jgi:hypothetical protein
MEWGREDEIEELDLGEVSFPFSSILSRHQADNMTIAKDPSGRCHDPHCGPERRRDCRVRLGGVVGDGGSVGGGEAEGGKSHPSIHLAGW